MICKKFAARMAAGHFSLAPTLVLVSSLLVFGCSKSGPSKDIPASAFDSAPPDVKQLWTGGMTAWKNHHFSQAATNFESLQSKAGTLSPQQVDSLTKAVEQFGQEAFESANKGDVDATEAVKALRGAGRRSGR